LGEKTGSEDEARKGGDEGKREARQGGH
jgi:hypothetical protein